MVSIMLIITSTFVIRQQSFNGSAVLSSLAYSVALSLRQAQLFGTATRETAINAFQGAAPAKAYGIYFDKNVTDSYKLFADKNNDGQYTTSVDPNIEETVQIFKMGGGYTLKQFCATNSSNTTCWDATAGGSLTYLTVLFRRPNPDACFTTNLSTTECAPGGTQSYISGYVQISGGAKTRGININLTGQITVGEDNS